MHVSANIIRFPDLPFTPAQPVESQPAQPPAEIVTFSPEFASPLDASSQEHGQIFAAHRIVSRVAAQLDQITSL